MVFETVTNEGRNQRGGQVQEQRADHVAEEEAPVPHPIGQVPRADRDGRQRGAARLQDRPAEGRHRHLAHVDGARQGRTGRHGRRPRPRGRPVRLHHRQTTGARLPAESVSPFFILSSSLSIWSTESRPFFFFCLGFTFIIRVYEHKVVW